MKFFVCCLGAVMSITGLTFLFVLIGGPEMLGVWLAIVGYAILRDGIEWP